MANPLSDESESRRPLLMKVGLAVVGAIVVLVGLKVGIDYGWLPRPATMFSSVPRSASLPTAPDEPMATTTRVVPLPSQHPMAMMPGPQIRFEGYAWNAQMGFLYATGGAGTTEGSLMHQHGVPIRFTRQDDNTQMQNDLAAFAKQYAEGREPTLGVHFVSIMGDGSAAFLAGLNPVLRKLGPDYTAEVIGVLGYSRGEDKFMGLPEWKATPRAAMGGLVAGVLRDGDWNIALKWLGDNGLPNNPDEKTWDPEALNWVNTDSYIDAAQKYIAGYCEDRPVVRTRRVTTERKHVCVQGVVTWTPGDVLVAKQRGGLVSILSTRENTRQMPAVVIGIRKWNREHRPLVEGMLAAAFEGAAQVQASPQALERAAAISAAAYKEKDAGPDYWLRYYKGVTERDALGASISLGGSRVSTLADNLLTFGLTPGSGNLFAATYRTFGDIVVQQYPKLVPSYPPPDEIMNTSYVQALVDPSHPAYDSGKSTAGIQFSTAPITNVVGRRAWRIQFETGRETFTPAARSALEQLYDGLLVGAALAVEIHGHTDAIGGADVNYGLSERRALAVKQWLEAKSPTNFPAGRIRVFAHGMTQPVASNDSEAGRAQNRRVEIVLGQ